MKFIRWTILFTVAGVLCFILASLTSRGLPESAQFGFPSSLFHHLSSRSGNIGRLSSAKPVQKSLSSEEMNGVDVINIETTGSDINIVRSDQNELTITGSIVGTSSETDALSLIKDGSRIVNVSTSESSIDGAAALFSGVWNFNSDEKPVAPGLTFKIPRSVKTVHVRTVSGNTNIDDSSNEPQKPTDPSAAAIVFEYRLESQSGDFFLESSEPTSKFTVDTVSGETRSRSGLRELDHKSVSGSLNLKNLPSDAKVRSVSVSGDVFLLYSDPPDAKLTVKSASGNFRLSLAGQKVITRNSSQDLTLGSGRGMIDVQTTSGGVSVTQATPDDAAENQ